MVDGVKFNPFTNKEFSVEEIEHLDINKDGKISAEELKTGMDWLSGGVDNEPEISDPSEIDDDSKTIFNNAKENGMKDKAENPSQLNGFASIVKEEFLQAYFKQHPELTKEDKSALEILAASTVETIIKKMIEKSPNGPFDMKSFTNEFNAQAKKDIDERTAGLKNANTQLSAYKNTEGKLESLADYAISASADYLTDAEFNKLVQDTVKYLMGELLNGNTENDILSNIAPKYQNNANFQKALAAIKSIENLNDPKQIQEAIAAATEALTTFVKNAGKEKLVQSVTESVQSKAEDAINDALTKIADTFMEQTIAANPGLSQEDIDLLTKQVQNYKTSFLSELAEKTPDLRQVNLESIAEEFASYIDGKQAALIQTKAAIDNMTSDQVSSYNKLVSASDSADKDKYISDEELENIAKLGAKFIISQIMNDAAEPALLKAVNSSYKSNKLYAEAMELINGMKTEGDPEKLKEMMEKATDLFAQILKAAGGKKLVEGVNSLKPLSVTDSQRDDIMVKSEIASDYIAGASRTGGYGKQNEDSLKEIQEMAKQDLQKIAVALKAQLKADLGTAYNEAEAEKYVQDAMNDTIAQFSSDIPRRKRGKSYNAGTDEMTFVFERRSGTKKGRYTYNVKALADSFIKNFNAASSSKHAAKLDPNLATYDKENVINATVGNDYYRNKTVTEEGKSDDNAVYAKVIEQARLELKSMAAQVKASMIAEGVPLSSAEIDRILDDAINETITDMKNAFQYCSPDGKNKGGIAAGAAAGLGAGVATVAGTGAALGATIGGTSLAVGAGQGLAVATGIGGGALASGQGAAAAAFCSAMGPVGWAAAGLVGVGALVGSFTNLFGATWGKHDAGAGFFFERKSHSHSGRWGYDTKTLVDTFFANITEKVNEAKEKNEKEKELQTKTGVSE